MILQNQLISKAISGVIEISEKDGWMRFSRFSKVQLDYFEQNEWQRLHAKANSGIKIDFYTDSETLKFKYIPYQGSQLVECFLDIYIDGIMRFHVGNNPIQYDEQVVSVALGEGKKRVTIYLPCLFGIELKDVQLDDGALFDPVIKQRKILFLGDSITQGCDAMFPSLAYHNLLAAEWDADILNQGVSGDVFNPVQLDGDIKFNPDTVFVAYGTNDFGRNEFDEAVVEEYFSKLTFIYPQALIYVLLPIWRADLEGREDDFEAVRSKIADICGKYEHIKVIDTIDMVPHFEEFYHDKFLHPNEWGFMCYAKGILNEVNKL